MSKLNKDPESRLMTLLVQVAGGISGALAVVAFVVALWPKVTSPVLPPREQPGAQVDPVQIATPYVPGIESLDGEVQERPAKHEIKPLLAPDSY